MGGEFKSRLKTNFRRKRPLTGKRKQAALEKTIVDLTLTDLESRARLGTVWGLENAKQFIAERVLEWAEEVLDE